MCLFSFRKLFSDFLNTASGGVLVMNNVVLTKWCIALGIKIGMLERIVRVLG